MTTRRSRSGSTSTAAAAGSTTSRKRRKKNQQPPPVADTPRSDDVDGASGTSSLDVPDQTPLFHALQQGRYLRQGHIRDIEAATGRRLICYVGGPNAVLDGYDVPPFIDMLDDVETGEDLDLLLHTYGGNGDQAERIVMMCRKKIGDKASFRVVVPDSAKSAGTLIAIGGDEIVMGYPSELGPIDPQITIVTKSGETMARPAQSFLDGLDEIIDSVGGGSLSPAYFPLLDKFDPALIDFCKKALARSEKIAYEFLKRWMLKGKSQKARSVANQLNAAQKHLSHGAVIDADRAEEMGLRIVKLEPHDPLWQAYWRLYCELRIALNSADARILESRRASLLV